MSVYEEVIEIIREIKELPEDVLRPDALIREDLEADSLDIVEMLMAIEDKYDIQIDEAATDALLTIQDAVNYIETKTGQK